jgi:hypothetical protein
MSNISRGETVQVEVYQDGSGACALITYGRYTFAFETLGDLKCNLIRPVSGSRIEHKIALDMCTKAYIKARDAVCDAAWFERNRVMYS